MNDEEMKLHKAAAMEQIEAENMERRLRDVITQHAQRIAVKRDVLEAEALVAAAREVLELSKIRHPLPQLKLDFETVLTMMQEALDRLRGTADLIAQGVDITAKLPDDLQAQVDAGLIHLHEAFKILSRKK